MSSDSGDLGLFDPQVEGTMDVIGGEGALTLSSTAIPGPLKTTIPAQSVRSSGKATFFPRKRR